MATWPYRTRKGLSKPEPELGYQDKWKPSHSVEAPRCRGNLRLGTTPFSIEAAQRMARRLRVLVEADDQRRLPEYWAARMGLGDVEARQVLGEYAELPE